MWFRPFIGALQLLDYYLCFCMIWVFWLLSSLWECMQNARETWRGVNIRVKYFCVFILFFHIDRRRIRTNYNRFLTMTSHDVQALSRKTNTQQESPFKLEQLGAQAKNMLCKIKHQKVETSKWTGWNDPKEPTQITKSLRLLIKKILSIKKIFKNAYSGWILPWNVIAGWILWQKHQGIGQISLQNTDWLCFDQSWFWIWALWFKPKPTKIKTTFIPTGPN